MRLKNKNINVLKLCKEEKVGLMKGEKVGIKKKKTIEGVKDEKRREIHAYSFES